MAIGFVAMIAIASGCTPASIDSSGPSVVTATKGPTGPMQVAPANPPLKSSRGVTTPVAAANALADASGWSQFRGPTGMGSTAAKLPTMWSQTENLAWKVPLPGPGASSPVVHGETIYLTYYSGYFIPGQSGGSLDDLKRHLLALKRSNGEKIWEKAIAAKLPEESKIRDHGFAASTAAADDAGVVVFFGKSGVIAFDHEGNQKWQADVGSRTNGWGSASSPLIYKDLVFINASVESETLYALDRKSGEVRWQQKGMKESWNTPVLVTAESGRQELIVAVQGHVLSFDPDKGTPLWKCKTDIGWYMVPSVVADKGIVYCLGGRSGIAALAVSAGGSGDVTASRIWTSTKGSNVTSPVFSNDHLYFANDSRGTAFCMKASTGDVLYEERLERADQIYGSAILAGGNVYYLSRTGKTFVIAAKPTFEQVAANDLNDRSTFNGSPQVSGNQILIRSDKFLYCVGK